MSNTVLRGFQIRNITVRNNQEKPGPMEIENKYNFNMHAVSPTRTLGEFHATISNKNNPDQFMIDVTAIGMCDHDEGKPMEEVHIEAMKEFYPFMKSFVWTLTANMGINPIMIAPINFDNISVVNFKIPPIKPTDGSKNN